MALLTNEKVVGIFADSALQAQIDKCIDKVGPQGWALIAHTDSDGNDLLNLDLSKRRGASVKSELVQNFNIDAAMIETDGKGSSVPVAPNNTPSNKALNRRVEFIKQ